MLERYLSLVECIGPIISKIERNKSSQERAPPMTSAEEEEIAGDIRDLLAPLCQVTTETSAEKGVTISKCIPPR